MRTKTWSVPVTRAITILGIVLLASMMAYAQMPAGAHRPASVPNGYVITPFGYFHPSCVLRLAEGDTLRGNGLVIQHADGKLTNIPACNRPRYSAIGKQLEPGAKVELPAIGHDWIVDGETTTNSSYGEITATWTVPPAPTSNDGQTIYFFPGFQDYNNVVSIVQPVLGWNSDYPAAWGIASWNCCVNGTTVESSPVSVNAGDLILGDIKSTCSAGTLTCATWNILTADVSSSKSTTLANSPSQGQTFNWAFGNALEVYNVVQCSDYPPNGALPLTTALYDNSFQLISNPNWMIANLSSGLTPQCNYGGQTAGDVVTLTYGGPLATAVTYNGATNGDYGMVAGLSAVLTNAIGNGGLAGETLTFTLGSQHCTGMTNASGRASCNLTLGQAPGVYTLTTTFAGDSNYKASSSTTSFTINKALSFVTYTGAMSGDYDDQATLSGVLTSEAGTDVPGMTITFALGSQNCAGITDASGRASCVLVLNQVPGPYKVVASFAGSTNYKSSSISVNFTIKKEEAKVSYTGDVALTNGNTAHLSGKLLEDGVTPISGRTLTFTLGSGAYMQTCVGVTNALGVAACAITVVAQPRGSGMAAVSFAGDAFYVPASASAATQVTGFVDATRLSMSPNPSTVGQSVRLQTVVVPGPGLISPPMPSTPTHTVTFYDQLTPLGTVSLDASGTATLYVQFWTSGPHQITAKYSGDSFFVPSQATATQTVR